MYLGALLIGMALVSVPSSSAYLKALHGFSDQDYGRVFLPQLVFAIAGALLAGPAVRRLSLKAMLLVAFVCFAGSQLALAASAGATPGRAFALILVCMGLFGFGFGFGGGPLNGMVASLFPRRSDAAITGLHLMAGAGLMLGPLFFRRAEALGVWSRAPLALVALAVVLFALTWFALREPPVPKTSRGVPAPSGSRYFWLMMAISFLYALIEGAFSNWAVIYVTDVKGQTRDAGAAALSFFWGGLTLGRLITTLTVGRLGAFAIWLALPVGMIGAFLWVPSADGTAMLWAAYALAGLACSAFFPLMVAIAAKPYREHLSWIASMLTAAQMLGVGAGSWLIGTMLERLALASLYRCCIILPLLAWGLMFIAKRASAPDEVAAETGYSRS
jgi:fucose permease